MRQLDAKSRIFIIALMIIMVFPFCFAYTNQSKIISYWTCYSNVSDSWGSNGTAYNHGDAHNITYTSGAYGRNACYFANDTTYIQINDSNSLDLTTNITICFTHGLNSDGLNARETYIFKWQTASSGRTYYVEHYDDTSKDNIYNFNFFFIIT